jgi:rubrerythrin
MSLQLEKSQTFGNLMRAFAGECMSQTRYLLAADEAQKQEYAAIARVFRFTAKQEKQHAKIFYGFLSNFPGTNIDISGGFPADQTSDIQKLLELAAKGESSEAGTVYPDFARIARDEGFTDIADRFAMIGEIENSHRKRFEYYVGLLRSGMLLRSESTEERWICLNCGHIHTGSEPPQICPVCGVDHGWSVREREADMTFTEMLQ